MVGLYFSASWCGPCQHFTPRLVEVYQELRAAGRKFEVIFISSDQSAEEFDHYFAKMPWLALAFEHRDLKADLSTLYEVNGIPSFILVDPSNGRIVTPDGRAAVTYGAAFWPFDKQAMARGKAEAEEREQRAREAAIKAEADAVAAQEAKPSPKVVVRRHCGPPGSLTLDFTARSLGFGAFTTAAANTVVPPGGKAYYELELVQVDSIAQVGWATDALVRSDISTGEGVGDGAGSWGVDGMRKVRWCGESTGEFGSDWRAGDIIGLAVAVPGPGEGGNEAAGAWVSINGSFAEPDGLFADGSLLELARGKGVFPAITGSPDFAAKYNFGEEPFKFAPPAGDFRPVLSFSA
mmetsp:Transcript_71961/g.192178  ORF Transcript_71961/g.192178 Transcript_71961/m.192178 type:complete len:350 (+) Transcript_71961:759-1808(+)